MEFIKENKNPKTDRAGDCVIRALAKAENKSWEEIFQDLVKISLKKCRLPNEKKVYEQYLKDLGYTKYKMPVKPNGKKYTVKEYFTKTNKKPIVVTTRKHMTCIIDNKLYDTWDCSNKVLSNYWIKE